MNEGHPAEGNEGLFSGLLKKFGKSKGRGRSRFSFLSEMDDATYESVFFGGRKDIPKEHVGASVMVKAYARTLESRRRIHDMSHVWL